MKNRILRITCCPRTVATVLFFISVVLVSVENTSAQPTDRRNFKEIEQDLQKQINAIDRFVSGDKLNPLLYRRRAALYQELYRLTQYYGRGHNETYAEKGLADFAKLVELNPTEESFAERARFYLRIWQTKKPPADQTTKGVEFFLRNSNFDGAESDYLRAIGLSTSDENLRGYFMSLSDLHWTRGAILADALEMKARNGRETYRVWADFDTAIDYAKKALAHAQKATVQGRDTGYWAEYCQGNVASVYKRKGAAASALGEFEIAIDAYRSGEKYLNERHLETCNYYAEWGRVYVKIEMYDPAIDKFTAGLKASDANCAYLFELRGDAYAAKGDLQRALADYTAGLGKDSSTVWRAPFAIKRAKVYLKLGEGDRALADLNYYIETAVRRYCQQPYLLRAQAHRQLGQIDLALADEEKAKRLAGNSPTTCADH